MRPKGEGTYREFKRAQHGDRKRIVFAMLSAVAVLGWLFIFLQSELFLLRSVEAVGIKSLDPVDVEREVLTVLDERRGWRPWSARHSLFVDKEHLEEEVKNRLFAENVTVDKITTHVLRLKIEERSKKLIFHTHQQYFWVDLQGVVTQELTLDERKFAQARILGSRAATLDDPPLIHMDLDELIDVGYVVTDGKTIRKWIQGSTEIMKAGLAYRELDPPGVVSSTTAVIKAPEGYKVYVDLENDLNAQVKSYLSFKKTKPADLQVTSYVDARIPGRVYVR
jgi:hypothetical protein